MNLKKYSEYNENFFSNLFKSKDKPVDDKPIRPKKIQLSTKTPREKVVELLESIKTNLIKSITITDSGVSFFIAIVELNKKENPKLSKSEIIYAISIQNNRHMNPTDEQDARISIPNRTFRFTYIESPDLAPYSDMEIGRINVNDEQVNLVKDNPITFPYSVNLEKEFIDIFEHDLKLIPEVFQSVEKSIAKRRIELVEIKRRKDAHKLKIKQLVDNKDIIVDLFSDLFDLSSKYEIQEGKNKVSQETQYLVLVLTIPNIVVNNTADMKSTACLTVTKELLEVFNAIQQAREHINSNYEDIIMETTFTKGKLKIKLMVNNDETNKNVSKLPRFTGI